MSTPKKTKFRAILKLEKVVHEMLLVGFTFDEIKDILRELLKGKKRLSPLVGEFKK
jgi:DNA-binding transcriptional regulator YhcF (GntR family)